jgi:hypothetical protein
VVQIGREKQPGKRFATCGESRGKERRYAVADLTLETLLHPPFENDPPVKLNISAKIIGLVAAILAALGLLVYIVSIPVVLAIGSAVTVLGVATGVAHPGILVLALLGLVVGLVADLLTLVGGWRMYQENREGKKLVIYGLVIGLLGNIVYEIGVASYGGFIFTLLIDFVIYYIVIISRFPGDAPLVTGTMPPPPPPPPPSQPPPAQPPSA